MYGNKHLGKNNINNILKNKIKMKTISPVVFPLNLGTATILNAYCINDNLNDSATFYYALLSDTQGQLSQGNLTMEGQDYADWVTNEYAYDFVASKIDVTIVGDYVPPVVEPVVEEIAEDVTVD
jgi:hypothetical protein